MKKLLTFALIALAVFGLGLGVTQAQNTDHQKPWGKINQARTLKNKADNTTWLQNLATLLNMSADELKTALENNKTIQQIAQEKGVTQEQLCQKKAEEIKNNLDKLVAEGKITQEQVNERIRKITENCENSNGKGLFFHNGFGRMRKK